MKQTLIELSQHYVAALRKHLKADPGASLAVALALGRHAVHLGLETLALARIHQQALMTLGLTDAKPAVLKRAELFFSEALTPIAGTHRSARDRQSELDRLNKTLNLRTADLAAANRRLQRDITRRENVEAALKKSGEHYAKLLEESQQLQQGLRQIARQVMTAQEDDRKKFSHELQDEIAQTLLGINVRLVLLKKEAGRNTQDFKNEVASAQRLVIKSKKTINRSARKIRSL